MTGIVKVLVVDDSAYVRKVVSAMLSRSPFLEVVATARDGKEALDLVEERQPDLVTCDLNMPDMDGVTFIREQMSRRRLPIVVMSVANAAGEQVLAALEAGAVDFVHKPTALASERLMDVADELIQKVKLAATASFRSIDSEKTEPPPRLDTTPHPFHARSDVAPLDIVVLGISTGGPQGLKSVIPRLPANLPVPVAIVLHMPVGYTELYAKKLNELCALDVVEARAGDVIAAGQVFLAPAGRHLSFRRTGVGGQVIAHLDVRPLDTPHRPAVDVLFQSAADIYGERTLGVVMTGMGADGRAGAAWIKAKGGRILTEAESSCVVYGMPRSVVEAGLSDECVPLDRMAMAIMEHL
jgi:two-component system, chemotaxis family, protein-glutamate methylesterase/glutaminase